ncbi:hypothetical protein DFJ77DRAFT_90092 [Powellomyces hirtus]|nr:hypothetical protein DFJ77DRAFT_90092 [Powellomyces hirtus]
MFTEVWDVDHFESLRMGIRKDCWIVLQGDDSQAKRNLSQALREQAILRGSYRFFSVDADSKAAEKLGEVVKQFGITPLSAPFMVVEIGDVSQGYAIRNAQQVVTNLYICLAHRSALLVLGYTPETEEQSIFLGDISYYLTNLGVPIICRNSDIFAYDAENTLRHNFLLPHPANGYIYVTVLINPSCPEVDKEIRRVFSVCMTGNPYLAYAGHGDDEGDWILRDDHFALNDLCDSMVAGNAQITQMTRDSQSGDIELNCCYGARWLEESLSSQTNLYQKEGHNLLTRIRLPAGPVQPIEISGLWQAAVDNGNIRGARGCLLPPHPLGTKNVKEYADPQILVFPANSGDCSLLSVGKFNLLIDGGLLSQLCCWPYLRRLPTALTGILVSHVDQDHVTGILSLSRTMAETSDTIGCAPSISIARKISAGMGKPFCGAIGALAKV